MQTVHCYLNVSEHLEASLGTRPRGKIIDAFSLPYPRPGPEATSKLVVYL